MNKLRFTNIRIENFCSIKNMNTKLFDKTLVKGKNAVGKSTIKNAINWVLFDKLADGSSATGIRPHDKSGEDIYFAQILVELMCDFNGNKITITKTQNQNFVKGELAGNKNEYMVDGIPMTEKAFKQYLEDNILSQEKLMLCMNPALFLGLTTAKKREKLFELITFDLEKVIEKNDLYKQFKDELSKFTVEDLTARSNKKIKQLKKQLEEYPVRINEIELFFKCLTAKITKNKATDRVDALKKLQRSVSQDIANEEKIIDVLNSFNNERIEMITDEINSNFDLVKWVFFEKQLNGSYKDICKASVNGSNYDGLLNHGDKLLAEIDICRAFAKSNNIDAPILLDDSESIDSNRIPKLPCQIITLRRTDDKKLMVKEDK